MKVLQYYPDVDREVMLRELKEVASDFVDLVFPTIFYFEGYDEAKTFVFPYLAKMVDTIYTNLIVLADRGWNAVIIADDSGFNHVFFGENKDEIKIPEVYSMPIIGSC